MIFDSPTTRPKAKKLVARVVKTINSGGTVTCLPWIKHVNMEYKLCKICRDDSGRCDIWTPFANLHSGECLLRWSKLLDFENQSEDDKGEWVAVYNDDENIRKLKLK